MAIRRITLELEAKLKGSGGGMLSRPRGKIERKSYAEGDERLKIRVENLDAEDGAIARVCADGDEIARMIVRDGAARLDEHSPDLPELDVGQMIEVQVGGITMMSGRLYVD